MLRKKTKKTRSIRTQGTKKPIGIIGLDVSLTCAGSALYTPDSKSLSKRVITTAIKTTKKDGSDELRKEVIHEGISSFIQTAIVTHRVCMAVFEDYGPISNRSGKIAQRAEIIGCLKHSLRYQLKIPYITVYPKTLKKFATGNGNANKNTMLEYAAKHSVYPDTHDEADAYFAAAFGYHVLTKATPNFPYTLIKEVH